MKIFLTGATGYIGGSVGARLVAAGHAVTGLVRSEEGARQLQAHGMKAVRTESAQIPALIDNAKKAGIGLHVGRGENRWANVHIDDVVDLYLLALEKAPAGALYYAENGEEALKDIAASISRMLGFGGRTRNWSPEDAEQALGPKAHSSFASNSRVRGKRSRAELGWKPKGVPVFEEIERGHYKRVHQPG